MSVRHPSRPWALAAVAAVSGAAAAVALLLPAVQKVRATAAATPTRARREPFQLRLAGTARPGDKGVIACRLTARRKRGSSVRVADLGILTTNFDAVEPLEVKGG